jgi:hypothetical protein
MLRHSPESSSNIEHFAYDPGRRALQVTFKSGGTWEYSGVDQGVFDGMKAAESVGGYLHRRVKGRYGERRI